MKISSSERPDHRGNPSVTAGARPPSTPSGTNQKSEVTSVGKAAGDGRVPTAPEATFASLTQPTRKSRLWLWFVLAFVVQLGAWVAWFMIANQHRVETVPLVTAGSAK